MLPFKNVDFLEQIFRIMLMEMVDIPSRISVSNIMANSSGTVGQFLKQNMAGVALLHRKISQILIKIMKSHCLPINHVLLLLKYRGTIREEIAMIRFDQNNNNPELKD